MEPEKIYYCNKKEVKNAIYHSTALSLSLALLVFAISMAKSYLYFITAFILMFLIILISSRTFINYKIMVNEQHIKSISIFNMFNKTIEWKNVDVVLIGQVEMKNSRWKNYFYGVEFRYRNEFGNSDSDSFKLSHLIGHEDLIKDIISIGEKQSINFIDMR